MTRQNGSVLQRQPWLGRSSKRVLGRDQYSNSAHQIDKSIDKNHFHDAWAVEKVKSILGVVESLHHDLSKGYLRAFKELIHADLFSDFL